MSAGENLLGNISSDKVMFPSMSVNSAMGPLPLSMYEMALLFIVAEREGRGDGLQAMRGVAHVIRNRVLAGWEGGSWFRVITFKNQFSSMTIVGDSQTVVWPVLDLVAVQMLADVYHGVDMDTTDGALYYANEAVEKSAWYLANVVKKLPIKVIIGRQTFR